MIVYRAMAIAFAAFCLVAAGRAQAEIKTEWLEYSHGDMKLKGYLAYDDAVTGKRPAVLVIHAREGMTAFVDLQEREFKAAEERGFTAVKHQREVGAGYFDNIATTVDPNSSTTALKGSTEEGQFH